MHIFFHSEKICAQKITPKNKNLYRCFVNNLLNFYVDGIRMLKNEFSVFNETRLRCNF